MKSLNDFDIVKLLLPKIPRNKDTFKVIFLGWAAICLAPIWVIPALGYLAFYLLHLLGGVAKGVVIASLTWIASEEPTEPEPTPPEDPARMDRLKQEVEEEDRKKHVVK